MHAYGHLRRAPSIPVRGKHLDVLEVWDVAFIAFNKLATTVFSYHLLRYLWCSDAVRCLCVYVCTCMCLGEERLITSRSTPNMKQPNGACMHRSSNLLARVDRSISPLTKVGWVERHLPSVRN